MLDTVRRVRFIVEGTVQGVGFRPFVYRTAHKYGIRGFVRNNNQGVVIEAEGPIRSIDGFYSSLIHDLPPLASITNVVRHDCPVSNSPSFEIEQSTASGQRQLNIPADASLCEACRMELFDPSNTRFRYPFIACTHCGPRFTIIRTLPYDRETTTMVDFPLCPRCDEEYHDPGTRRFHAEATGCVHCGPRLELLTAHGRTAVDDLGTLARMLIQGGVVAVKGIGGYHLAAGAWNDVAVRRLRDIKERKSKPFALMARDLSAVREICALTKDEEALLSSPAGAIVLLRQRTDVRLLSPDIAPGLTTVGVMLPYSPLHALILEKLQEYGYPPIVVLTSANRHGDPVIFEEKSMIPLHDRVDAILQHNRKIQVPADDSVVQLSDDGALQVLRRARGFVPTPMRLSVFSSLSTLALGGHNKSTFCVTRGNDAILGPHIGDLDTTEAHARYRFVLEHILTLAGVTPANLAMDLHPHYGSARIAEAWPEAETVLVQHHHAHVAAVMGECHIAEPVVGLALDGTGMGTDGAIWGGEVLMAGLADFTRVGHLRYVPLIGGDHAVREPWRMAATYLQLIYGDRWVRLPLDFCRGVPESRWRFLKQIIDKGGHGQPTSSTGRLFDAVSALVTGRMVVDYEAQAAMELEQMARLDVDPYTYSGLSSLDSGIIDPFPLIEAVVDDLMRGENKEIISGRFHRTLAAMFAGAGAEAAKFWGIERMVAAGGVMQNRVFVQALRAELAMRGYRLELSRKVPCNDGGLSYGQAVVAQARVAAREMQRHADRNKE